MRPRRWIRSRWNASAVILYGSFARGDVYWGSDIDLLIVGDLRERFHRRPAAVLELTDPPSNRSAIPKKSLPG
ncbi:MAG: nucleotidyltransferase domain-containing protein [Methanomicrobiaceae archaeon]|nr:nucleotidyltransferase domain-containing protein [Methanomicrobiaceae archaeon]